MDVDLNSNRKGKGKEWRIKEEMSLPGSRVPTGRAARCVLHQLRAPRGLELAQGTRARGAEQWEARRRDAG